MVNSKLAKFICAGMAALTLTACESLPGTRKQQGAVIGGAAGAATGAAVAGSGHRAVGAVLGGLLGAGGGYVIAAQTDKVKNNDSAGAAKAMQNSQTNPATPEQARTATTADLNHDGFVTLDEVVAMKNAGFSDQKMLDMMRATGQVFDLTQQQKDYLKNQGVSQNVIDEMATINQSALPGTTTAPTAPTAPPTSALPTPPPMEPPTTTTPTVPTVPTTPTTPTTPPPVISQPK